MHVWRSIEGRSCTHCFSGKAKSVTYSKCVFVAIGVQLAMTMCHIVICDLSGCTIFFSTLSHKWQSYWTQNVIWFSLQLLCKPFLILRRTERDIIINIYWSSCQVLFVLVRCYSTDCRKTLVSDFTKIRPVVAELFHANGRTWRSLWLPSAVLRTRLKTANSETEVTVNMTRCENFDLKMSRRGVWGIKRRSICVVTVTLTVPFVRNDHFCEGAPYSPEPDISLAVPRCSCLCRL
jgi:hypothetical protein